MRPKRIEGGQRRVVAHDLSRIGLVVAPAGARLIHNGAHETIGPKPIQWARISLRHALF